MIYIINHGFYIVIKGHDLKGKFFFAIPRGQRKKLLWEFCLDPLQCHLQIRESKPNINLIKIHIHISMGAIALVGVNICCYPGLV
jgi:hypothetical protein